MQEQTQEDSQKPQCKSTLKDMITLTDVVSLDKLSLMKLPSGERVKIIETVAKDWRKVGSQLNFDRVGNQLDIIERQKSNNPVACCEAMFQHWLNGNGVKPITWNKLIDILKDCECITLAEQVQRALMEFQHPVLSIQKSRTPATEHQPVTQVCMVAGCSFKGVPELEGLCPNCYDECSSKETHTRQASVSLIMQQFEQPVLATHYSRTPAAEDSRVRQKFCNML